MLGLILNERKFIYTGYEIMKMNAISNVTKLEVIFFLEDQMFNKSFYIQFHVMNLLKRNMSKN